MSELGASEQLSAYLDGELTDTEITDIEANLARDPGLRAELEALQLAAKFMQRHGSVAAPPNLYGDILRKVEDEPMPGGWWRALLRPFGLPLQGLAVAAIAVAVVFVAMSPNSDTPSTNPSAEDGTTDERPAAIAPMAKAPKEGTALPPADQAIAINEPPAKSYGQEDYQGELKDLIGKRAQQAQQANQTKSPAPEAEPEVNAQAKIAEEPQVQAPAGLAEGTSANSDIDTYGTTPGRLVYALDTDDGQVLDRLVRLVARYRGTVSDGNGEVTPQDLATGSKRALTVRIPSTMLTDFIGDAKRLGVLTRTDNLSSSDFLSAPTAELRINVAVTAPVGEAVNAMEDPVWSVEH